MRRRAGFTLAELLVTMAIIGLLTGLLVTAVNRSLVTNHLSEDVTLLGSNISEIRSLAGSTQQSSSSPGLQTDPDSAYYAVYIPAGPAVATSYALVKVSSDLQNGTCAPGVIYSGGTYKASCLINQVSLTSGATLTNPSTSPQLVAFQAPAEELVSFSNSGGTWQVVTPNFSSPFIQLTYAGKTATVSISSATAQVTAVYQ